MTKPHSAQNSGTYPLKLFFGLLLLGNIVVAQDVSAKLSMQYQTVEEAMALIRQHKFAEAREILFAAAERGEVEPQALLGRMYSAGWGVEIDYAQALKWWTQAAAGGSSDALWGLGLLHDEGHGVTQDSRRALEFWRQAAELGNIKATVNLAFAYEGGCGVDANPKEAAKLFMIAAQNGEPFAQVKYGLKLLAGKGVEQNKPLGCAWLAVAAESEITKASQMTNKITSMRADAWDELSASDKEKAESLKHKIQERLKTREKN